ncbi:unnamed protein product [Darwinula stevensoni]|uniref:G-protein coupled receptors family 1 profile domain-containing protein n=1 Tax=Darwinula stevensoni TaxID=69355 RepID=A0A7R8XH48_9CRUS|nr:unnamed protein product [Darwinula stevensoni]CAG0892158.1 unnamed protein product [Darwinula stevensoni]
MITIELTESSELNAGGGEGGIGYYAILHPMKAKYICTISQAKKVIIGIWISSFILAAPSASIQVLHPKNGMEVEGKKYYWCTRNFDAPVLWRSFEIYMLLLVFVVPGVIMTLSYTAICREVGKVMRARAHMTNGTGSVNDYEEDRGCEKDSRRGNDTSTKVSRCTEEDAATSRQVVRMLVVVVLLFLLSWGPSLIENVLTSFDVIDELHSTAVLKHMRLAFALMAYFNSCVNPIVYGFMSRNFREGFRQALSICWKKKLCRRSQDKRTVLTSPGSPIFR